MADSGVDVGVAAVEVCPYHFDYKLPFHVLA